MLVYLVLALATWRISSLLVNEDGPWFAFARLRARVGVRYSDETFQRYATNQIAGAFICVWCMSVWVGLSWALAWELWPEPTTWVAWPLALSAGSILVEKVVK
jgi:hypothetical protein